MGGRSGQMAARNDHADSIAGSRNHLLPR